MLIFVLGVGLYGCLTPTLWKQHLWDRRGAKDFVYFAVICCLLGAVSAWRSPARTRAHLLALALLVGVVLLGPGPVAAVAFVLAGCAALGDAVTRLLRWTQGAPPSLAPLDSEAFAVSAFTGLALYTTLLAFTAPLRLHYLASWAFLLAIPLVFNSSYREKLIWFVKQAFAPVPNVTRAGALPLIVLGIGLLAHLVLIPKPEAGGDGLAMHLALPVRLAANHFFAYDPGAFLWSLMPMAGTFSFAIAYMLGGEAAARLLDFAQLGLVVLLLVRILRRWTPEWVAWLVVGVFVSTPLVQMVTADLMIENAQAGFLLAAFAALLSVWKSGEESLIGERSAAALLAGLLAGASLSCKFGSLAIAGPIVVLAAIAVPRRAVAVAGLFLAFGLPPYVNAWIHTGNPLFPFMGNVFPSQYANAKTYIKDMRWRETPSWRTLYDLTFHSSRFYESQDGGFGFQSLLLLPLALAIPYRRWPWVTRAPFWLALAATPLIMLSVPHLRYLYTPLVFSSLALAIPLTLGGPRFQRVAVVCACAAWALNLCFLPSANSYHKDFLLNPFRADAASMYRRNMAPLDSLADYVNMVQPGAAVATLDCETGQIADFTGPTYMNNWHSGRGRFPLSLAKNENDILNFARQYGIQWFTGCRAGSKDAQPGSPTQRFLDRYTADVFLSGYERLARLKPEYAYTRELLVNGDFQDTLHGWNSMGDVAYVPEEKAVRVTADDYLMRRVPIEAGASYRVVVRARCPEPGTLTRLQVNWTNKRSTEMPVAFEPLLCSPEWTDYSDVFTAPPDSVAGYVYATGHNHHPVFIQRVSITH